MAIDSRLKWVLAERATPVSVLTEAVEILAGSRLTDDSGWRQPRSVEVLVRAVPAAERDGFVSELKRIGFEIHSVAGRAGGYAATGLAQLDELVRLDTSPMVARVEAPRDLSPELTVSVVSSRAQEAHQLAPPALGGRALVGVVDGGIDYTHPVFQDAGGRSRIVALWDQAAVPPPGAPAGDVPYGVVYSKADIDAALTGVALPHRDPFAHGTHVASIAAGAAPRMGVAPAANLLVVSLSNPSGETLGRSKQAVEAIDWIVRRARALHLPVAINMSQGMNGGGHVGSSVLELAMDAHCRTPGVAIVKSAGNEQEWRIHASGSLATGQLEFEIECQPNKQSPGALEIWFDGATELEVSVQPPSGPATAWVNQANMPQTLVLAGGNRMRVDVEFDPEHTKDNLLNLFFSTGGNAIGLIPGTWRVRLRSVGAPSSLPIHAWLERGLRNPTSEQLRFSQQSHDPTCTITVPGTARRVITVGSYVTTPRPAGSALVGALSSFSSCGPTRYDVQKPDICAPGEWIEAARSAQAPGVGQWISINGTSMAAPHVAGAAALVLAENPRLTGEQVRQILARAAMATSSTPDNSFGCGKLDACRSVELVRAGEPSFPVVASATLVGMTLKVTTNDDSTASLLYDRSAGRVLAGRRQGALPSLVPAKVHVFDLTVLGPGDWFFEVHLFAAGWRTIADDDGAAWNVTVPTVP